jgi:hypothetical protein
LLPSKRPSSRPETRLQWVATIDCWSIDFSVAIGEISFGDRRHSDPYAEYREIEMVGRLPRPREFEATPTTVTATFVDNLTSDKRTTYQPRGCGEIQPRDGALVAYALLPETMDAAVLALLGARRLCCVTMMSGQLRLGPRKTKWAVIQHLAFRTGLDDWELEA